MQIFGSTGNLLWSTRAKPEISPSWEQDNPPKILFFPEIVFKLFPFREQDNPPKILFSRTENRTIHPKFSRNCFQIISFSQLGRKHVMWAALIVMLILIVIHSKKKGGDTNTTDKIETQLQITKILFEIPDGQPLSWGHRQPLPTGANSSPASPVKLVLKMLSLWLLTWMDLDGFGWTWMDLDGLEWTWMDLKPLVGI